MSISCIEDEALYEEYIRETLKLTGDHAELALETARALRRGRDQLIVCAYAAGMTQSEIAELAHVDQSLVSRVLTSKRRQLVQDETKGGTVR